MTVSLKHAFTSAAADGADTSLVRPSNWNEEHQLTMATGKVLGRTTAGTGSAEEIAVGTGLSLTAGSISNAGVTAFNTRTGSVTLSSSDVTTALGYTPEDSANEGAANGYASLDGSGKVPAAQLPSYVDDVVEAADLAALPATGETGKIYVTLDTNKTYRWSGSAYVEISASPGSTDAVTEGSSNLYFTTARARSAISAGGSLSYNSSTGVISYTAPTLATVATTGAYADLTGKPTNISSFNNDSGYLSTVSLATNVTGTLPVANGGTGAQTLTSNAVLLGNGTGAVQTVAPSTAGNVLTSDGTTWTSAAAAGGGGAGWTLISTITANNSATVEFSTGIGTTYDNYVVVAHNLVAGTNATSLGFRLRRNGILDNGATYQQNLQNLASNSATPTYTRGSLSMGTVVPSLADNSGGTFGAPGAFTAFFYNLNATGALAYVRPYTVQASAYPTNANTASSATSGGGTYFDASSPDPAAITAIRFLMSSGNIASGTFRLYGIQKA